MEDQVDCARVILDIEPIAHVLATTINRQGAALADIVDKQRYKFLGELIRTVVIRAVADHRRQPECVVERANEVVARRLTCRVGRVGLVARRLGEGALSTQRTVNLIGRNVVEEVLRVVGPTLLSHLQQRQRTQHIGAREGKRIVNRAIDVALRRQMDHAVDCVALEDLAHGLDIANIDAFETVVCCLLDIAQIGGITRVGQRVEIDNQVVGISIDHQSHQMRTDESCAARDQNFTFHSLHFARFTFSRRQPSRGSDHRGYAPLAQPRCAVSRRRSNRYGMRSPPSRRS